MKIRNGFVSNSSSSSFVLGKYFLTDEQIKQFKNALSDINENSYEGYIGETKHYFQGEADNNSSTLDDLIDEMGIREFCSWYC